MKKIWSISLIIAMLLSCAPFVLADQSEYTNDRVIPIYRAVNAQQYNSVPIIPVEGRFSINTFKGFGWDTISDRETRDSIFEGELQYASASGRGYASTWVRDLGVVICNTLSIREDRTTKAKVLVTARNGETLWILSEAGDWYQVRHVDKKGKETTGWARSTYIVKNPITVTTVRAAMAYSYPSLAAKCVGSLVKDTKLTVIGQYGDFYCVNLRSASAFLLKKDCAVYTEDDTVGMREVPVASLARGLFGDNSSLR